MRRRNFIIFCALVKTRSKPGFHGKIQPFVLHSCMCMHIFVLRCSKPFTIHSHRTGQKDNFAPSYMNFIHKKRKKKREGNGKLYFHPFIALTKSKSWSYIKSCHVSDLIVGEVAELSSKLVILLHKCHQKGWSVAIVSNECKWRAKKTETTFTCFCAGQQGVKVEDLRGTGVSWPSQGPSTDEGDNRTHALHIHLLQVHMRQQLHIFTATLMAAHPANAKKIWLWI